MIGIYLITNQINGKKYVGMSNNINRRFAEHKHTRNNKNTPLARAFRKYSIENFSFEILQFVDSVKDLAEAEKMWISNIKPEYNVSDGGLGNLGHSLSEDVKNHLRLLGKIQWASKTDIEKQQQIANLTGRKKGYKQSDETKNKLRLANLGKKQSEETIFKKSEKNKFSLIGNSNGNKSIIGTCIETGNKIEFDSSKHASEYFNIHPATITHVLKGRRKTAAKHTWTYKHTK